MKRKKKKEGIIGLMHPWWQVAVNWGIWLSLSTWAPKEDEEEKSVHFNTHNKKDFLESLDWKYALNSFATYNKIESQTSSGDIFIGP